MIIPRIIPCLLLKGEGLVKTCKFKNPVYLGDPRNIVRIFNEKEVDEIIILDIDATIQRRGPRMDLVREIVSEAFMPVAYGGGIRTVEEIKQLINIGVEKVVINSHVFKDPNFISKAVNLFGSQSIVVCMDLKKNFLGHYELYSTGATINTKIAPLNFARQMESAGVGELMINSIDRDGTMIGYDIELVRSVASIVKVPVIASGGAGTIDHFFQVVKQGNASAVAAGSMFVFHGKYKAVLISYPEQGLIQKTFQDL